MNQIALIANFAYPHAQCLLSIYVRCDNVHLVLIGTSLDALLLADRLASDHTITMIEIEAEIGMPVHHPGRFLDKTQCSAYFTEQQQEFFALKQNPDGWGCRWEWVLKFLSHRVAAKGVTCLIRTRVLDASSDESGHVLHLSENERNQPSTLMADLVIDCSTNEKTPGLRKHNLEAANILPYTYGELALWHGMIVLQSDLHEPSGAVLTLGRADGLTELWWNHEPEWTPTNGALEQCETYLPSSERELSFDAAVARTSGFIDQHL